MKSLLYEMDIRREGREEGREIGHEEERTKINLLNGKLLEGGRMDDIARSISDPKYQDKLFKEFGIE